MKLDGTKESRTAIRILAGRPGRMYISENNEEVSVRCDVLDISTTGCRLIVKRDRLPFDTNNISEKTLLHFYHNWMLTTFFRH